MIEHHTEQQSPDRPLWPAAPGPIRSWPNWLAAAALAAALVSGIAGPAAANEDQTADEASESTEETTGDVTGEVTEEITEHTVVSGDTLWGISRDHNVSLASLLAHNDLEISAILQVGDVIELPDRPWSGPLVVHTVLKGESLSEIAEAYDVTEGSLLRLNDLDDPDLIQVGEELDIPQNSGARDSRTLRISHTVGRGEVLGTIAEEYEVEVSAILAANELANPDFIRQGDVLTIPGVSPRTSTEELTVLFEYWADEFSLDRNLLKAIGYQESTWRPDAESSVGAMGIAQIMPPTATWIQEALLNTSGLDAWDPDDNLQMSAAFLAHLIEETDGDERMAVGSYYQGLGSVRKNGFYGETERYIAGVYGYAEKFADGVLPGQR